jgi:hypothetical protein
MNVFRSINALHALAVLTGSIFFIFLAYGASSQIVHAASSANFSLEIIATSTSSGGGGSGGGGGGGGSGGGGGGGGAAITPTVSQTSVFFTLQTIPNAAVTVLRDSQVAATSTADTAGHASLSLTDLAEGDVRLTIFAQIQGQQSTPVSFTVHITKGSSTSINNLLLPPMLTMSQTTSQNQPALLIQGWSTPGSTVTISTGLSQSATTTVIAGANGQFSQTLFIRGEPLSSLWATAFATIGTLQSATTNRVQLQSSTQNNTQTQNPTGGSATSIFPDFNHDGHINLIDFSILAFWYRRPKPPAYLDLNSDGVIDLKDFSILAFHWTG